MSQSVTVTTSSPILWSDGSTFDGFIVFLTVVPSTFQQIGVNGEVISNIPTFAKSLPPMKAPLWQIVPIRDGAIDPAFKVWKTNSYHPVGCKYNVYLFDMSWTHITGTSGFPTTTFAITGDTYTFTFGPVSTASIDGDVMLPQPGEDSYAIGSGGVIATPGVFFVSRVTLTSSGTINYTVQATDSVLFLFLTEDGTGGWIPTFGPEFVGVDASDMNTDPGKTTAFIFVSNGTSWISAGVRTTT